MAMANVIEEFPDACAVIAGSGSYTDDLRTILNEKDLTRHVKLVGAISEAEKWAFYNRADVVVFPSLYEPFGIVLLEAMSAGKAIVASNLGGFSRLLQDGKIGFLVTPGSSEEIAEKVKTLLRNRRVRRKFEETAQRSFTSHDWRNIVERFIDTYLEQEQVGR
jgi:glycosyltransferase involved in cell wall biosynthesis